MMFPRTKKNSLTKKVLSVSLIGCITVTIMAAGMQPFLVYASVGSGTLRGLLIGASAMLGTGNINPTSVSYLNTNSVLNSSIESIYDGTVTVSDINSAISGEIGTARWTAPLANNAQQVTLAQEYVSAAGGDPASLNGLGAASVGENIKAMADYYYEHGELKPAFGGQTITDNIMGAAVMQSMADVAYNFDNAMWYARENGWTDEQIDALFDSGAAFGDLQGAIDYIENLDKTITHGIDVDTTGNAFDALNNAESLCVIKDNSGSRQEYILGTGVIGVTYTNSFNKPAQRFVSLQNGVVTCYRQGYANPSYIGVTNNQTVGNNTFKTALLYGGQEGFAYNVGFYNVGDISNWERNSYALLNNGTILNAEKESPDIITQDGQAKGTVTVDNNDNPVYNLNINPVINNNNYNDYNYVLPDDTVIDTAIYNIQDAVEGKEQAEEQLQQAIINNSSQETINNIQETINNYEQTIINNYNYIIESMQVQNDVPQPTEAPQPTVIPPQPTEAPKPTNTPEQEEQNQQAMATVDLADKFPFCIPFDIYSMMGNFVANRSAPYIKAELNLGPAGVHYIEIDMSEFDEVAALLRTLQLILFIVGLALVARKLIGAGGD